MRIPLDAISSRLTRLGIALIGAVRRHGRAAGDATAGQAITETEDPPWGFAARDLTEEATRLTEERFRTPADQVVDYAIFMVDSRGRHATWNKGVQRLLGYEQAQFLGSSFADLFTPENRAAGLPARQLAEAAQNGRAGGERWLVRKDGTRLWASLSTTRVLDGKGRLAGFAQTLRNLSGIRRVEEELRRKQEALEVALEAAQLGTWDQDLVTGEMRCDPRAKALLGLPPDATLCQRTWAEALHPEDLGPAEAARERALRDRTALSIEYRVVWPDGSVHSIAVIGRASFEPATGRPLRIAGIMLDITERKRTEERLQEVLRLEAIGRLAGGIAHDLNNMLAAILGFSDVLMRSLTPDDTRRQAVEQIAQAAARSASLTRQLLAFARRELIQPRRIDVNAVVRRAERMLRPVLSENVELVLELSPNVGVVYADAGQVEQILMNLVLNARDAMPQGGRVGVETTSFQVEEGSATKQLAADVAPGRYLVLRVSDTGHGMDTATLQRIWEPFFTTKEPGHGTGLGLAAVYGAVKQSGGFVRADSGPGRGTVVSVYWPEIPLEPEQLGEEATPPPAARGTERLLVVEDESLVRTLMVRTLTAAGYQCLEAPNAHEALHLLEDKEVHLDLVVTDVVLPGQSGRWLGEQLALTRPGLPVLYTSGFADEDVIRRGLLPAGRPFLPKPFAPDDLAREVRKVLDAAGG